MIHNNFQSFREGACQVRMFPAAGSCGQLTITTTSPIDSANVASLYSFLFQATGGCTPYSWTVTSGSLPSGLSLATTGLLTGRATTTGSYSFTVTVTDSHNRTASLAVTMSVVVNVLYTNDFSGGIGNFRVHFPHYGNTPATLAIASNTLTFSGGGGGGSNRSCYCPVDAKDALTVSQYCKSTFQGRSNTNARGGPCIFAQGDENTSVVCYSFTDAGATSVLEKGTGIATNTTLISGLAAFVVGDVIEIRGVLNGGNVDLTVLINSVVVGTITDSSSPITSGMPGISWRTGAATTQSWGSFECGTL